MEIGLYLLGLLSFNSIKIRQEHHEYRLCRGITGIRTLQGDEPFHFTSKSSSAGGALEIALAVECMERSFQHQDITGEIPRKSNNLLPKKIPTPKIFFVFFRFGSAY